ncbi:LL-diaminopimelate aminotransferase apoenzyme [Desulfacinum hydrothermale DSM 13146]|uniref:Aminotransferase n=1 Tax=Desulfacinum hydrothermale DSM 13146 TaxID=1121390 RepID=A0A1W1X8L4_9BACT|nr:LL-diaminopimelate aminotransferase [Desulfacinum hydrothermale]SMC20170.1 LL-diaminopimelate aminotransferase apoenzyme [Desulfacinum hydrothermale DSM 13146]
MAFEFADRVKKLPPYLFKEIDRLKAELIAQGVDVINLGVGDPDLPTPQHIIDRLHEAAQDPANHQYPSYSGMNDFKGAVARWYQRRFGVELDPNSEVITLIGSKEGIAHLPLAFINPGDVALVPSPAYPVYSVAVMFAGGTSHPMPLVQDNGFLPDLEAIPADVARRAKLLFINYPNNPTGATAEADFYEKVVAFAKEYDIIVCHDAAYTEMAFDGYKPMSFLEVPGAKEVGIEFHSLSKTYNMTGWRLGFAVGNAHVLEGLAQIKSNVDSGAFNAIQLAGIAALEGDQSCVHQMQATYQERRDVLIEGLHAVGLRAEPPKATFYVWCPTPNGMSSAQFTSLLLKEAGIVTTPGSGFGAPGEGFVRMALTVSKERIQEAVERIRKVSL